MELPREVSPNRARDRGWAFLCLPLDVLQHLRPVPLQRVRLDDEISSRDLISRVGCVKICHRARGVHSQDRDVDLCLL